MHCLDKPGMEEIRAAAMPGHREYLDNAGIKIVMSGPLVDDDDPDKVIGSLYVMEAQSRNHLEEFLNGDPLVQADIWKSKNIQAFNKRIG
jgi:hypothetical protein